ncbi:peptide-methionine (R)-S-oxide reductase MsrB [Myroides phaeus]|uniref:peptide-methionine (R)-S-oxide reductase MsrB n=1 Tax=Myroides phaeus TaxID=702745 RepID=UPI0013038BC2|nr:peptide-methionine (R)-S-oxide reductase MsrB [Myroides phaeus]
MKYYLFLFMILSLIACKNTTYQNTPIMKKDTTTTEEQWQQALTPEQYYVLRQKGTERPFTGEYNDLFEKGSYHCAGCNQKLFDSDTKFDSHCGWPSFDKAIKGSVEYIRDTTHGMIRTEVVCSTCHGHLGHVFPDGPQETTGERYCMNSISLKFVSEK